jgi:hypothetical protein
MDEVMADEKTANIERLLSIARGKAAENKVMIDNRTTTTATASSRSQFSTSVTLSSASSIETMMSAPLEKRVRKKR